MLVSSVQHSDSVIYIVFSRLFSLTGYYKLLSRVPCACWLFIYSSVSVQFNHSVVSNSLRPHGLQHARLPCPSPTLRACSNSCPSSQWCHPTISSSVIPFSSCLQSFPASGSFPRSWFFASGGQTIGVSVLEYSSIYTIFILFIYLFLSSLVAQKVKHPPAMWETGVQSLGWEDPLEKEKATHSSILAWKSPWTEEPGRLLRPWGGKASDTTEQLHFFTLHYF